MSRGGMRGCGKAEDEGEDEGDEGEGRAGVEEEGGGGRQGLRSGSISRREDVLSVSLTGHSALGRIGCRSSVQSACMNESRKRRGDVLDCIRPEPARAGSAPRRRGQCVDHGRAARLGMSTGAPPHGMSGVQRLEDRDDNVSRAHRLDDAGTDGPCNIPRGRQCARDESGEEAVRMGSAVGRDASPMTSLEPGAHICRGAEERRGEEGRRRGETSESARPIRHDHRHPPSHGLSTDSVGV